ncbi:MAG: EAL domain-containing protein [Rhodanobacter sp.]
MSIGDPPIANAADQEAYALIATLHATGLRLEELTGGEVDAVIGRDGATFLLRRAQEELRLREAAMHAAILNALQANIALIDNRGVIVSVNRTWSEFAETNGFFGPGHGVGVDYLGVCETARQGGNAEGGLAGDGIRSVLAGDSKCFSMDYACHSPTQRRWFLMTVTPLSNTAADGAVITHRDITAEHRAKDNLLASELQFRQIAESVGDVFTLREVPSLRTIYVNQAYETVWGRTCASLYARPDSWIDAVHPDDVRSLKWKDISEATVPHVEQDFRIVCPDGETRWIEARRSPVRNDTGIVVRVATISTDITRRKHAELGMKRLNRVYSVLGAMNALTVRVRDRENLFREACRIAVENGGFQAALVITVDRQTVKSVAAAIKGKNKKLVSAIEAMVAQNAIKPGAMIKEAIEEKRVVVSNDSQSDANVAFGDTYAALGAQSKAIFPLLVANEVVGVFALYASESGFFHAEEMRLLSGLADDISLAIYHIDNQDRLNYLASYDALTGLANRALFLDRVRGRLLQAGDGATQAVFELDIQHFKNINDVFGREDGDNLLRQVAQRLIEFGGDASRCAHLGADRFAVVSEIDGAEQAGRLAQHGLEAIFHLPFRVGENDVRISVNTGIALFPDDGRDAGTLLHKAEAATKNAKATGEPFLFFTQAMTERVTERLLLETQLRRAIDNEEFVLYYQPKLDCSTGEVTSVEALIRWNDPKTGLVPPDAFIPVLEESGLIGDVGRWAMRKAIGDYLRWCNEGLTAVRIAVNVSALQMRSREFVAEIQRAISIDKRAAAGLEIEITESMLMKDVEQAIVTLRAIRALGVTIAIDDFGTGFSSLGYLSKLPVDTLKIDRMFVTDMPASPQGLSLVSTIINLAHSLQLNVVAEGVETEEQSRLLMSMQCDEMQGYLFSKPVPTNVLEEKFLGRLPRAH